MLFFLSSVAFVWIARSGRGSQQQKSLLQDKNTVSSLVAPKLNFDATNFFRQAYYSPLQAEVETNIRAAAAENQPNDREGFFVKFIGVGLISYTYDMIWTSIYRSQLLMLLELNRKQGLLPLAEVKTYYAKAALEYPTFYGNYSFDEWMAFMKSNGLVLRHPSDMVEITLRGKDFLRYLVHWGRYQDQRTL
jgi:hypothetical protein